MRYSIRTVTPASEPLLSLADAKAHLRVTSNSENDLIEAYVLAAQDHIERYTSRLLTPVELEFSCAGFPCSASGAIVIPRDPITAINAIAYDDAEGDEVALVEADWRWSESAPDQVLPAYGTSWPSAYDGAASVRVTFDAGYEAGLCPASLVTAVRLLLGTLFHQRESVASSSLAELPGGVAALCAPYRRISL